MSLLLLNATKSRAQYDLELPTLSDLFTPHPGANYLLGAPSNSTHGL